MFCRVSTAKGRMEATRARPWRAPWRSDEGAGGGLYVTLGRVGVTHMFRVPNEGKRRGTNTPRQYTPGWPACVALSVGVFTTLLPQLGPQASATGQEKQPQPPWSRTR